MPNSQGKKALCSNDLTASGRPPFPFIAWITAVDPAFCPQQVFPSGCLLYEVFLVRLSIGFACDRRYCSRLRCCCPSSLIISDWWKRRTLYKTLFTRFPVIWSDLDRFGIRDTFPNCSCGIHYEFRESKIGNLCLIIYFFLFSSFTEGFMHLGQEVKLRLAALAPERVQIFCFGRHN